ncbi:hypothetical protein Aros01_05678 [Streptosporangium roseum]
MASETVRSPRGPLPPPAVSDPGDVRGQDLARTGQVLNVMDTWHRLQRNDAAFSRAHSAKDRAGRPVTSSTVGTTV